jgi:hypothetical protein
MDCVEGLHSDYLCDIAHMHGLVATESEKIKTDIF